MACICCVALGGVPVGQGFSVDEKAKLKAVWSFPLRSIAVYKQIALSLKVNSPMYNKWLTSNLGFPPEYLHIFK